MVLTMNDVDKPLTPKEEQFCHEFQVDLNGAAAARRAKYAEKSARITASKLLTKPNIARRLAELRKERLDKTDVEAEDVVRMLAETYEDARAAKQYGPAVRAAELLGKRHVMFTDRVVRDDDRVDPKDALRELCADNPDLKALLWPMIFGEELDEQDAESVTAAPLIQ